MAKVTTVMSARPGQSAAIEITQETKDEIDGAWSVLSVDPNREGLAEFADKEERNAWLRQARTYCQTREAGALKFRVLPSKHLGDTLVRFQLSVDVPAEGQRNGQPNHL